MCVFVSLFLFVVSRTLARSHARTLARSHARKGRSPQRQAFGQRRSLGRSFVGRVLAVCWPFVCRLLAVLMIG